MQSANMCGVILGAAARNGHSHQRQPIGDTFSGLGSRISLFPTGMSGECMIFEGALRSYLFGVRPPVDSDSTL